MTSSPRKPLRFTSTRPWTREDEDWEELSRLWEGQALPGLRAAADRWAAGLAIVLGGSGVGIFLGGPQKLAPLTACYEAWAKGLLFGSAIVATAALAIALLAGTLKSQSLFLVSGPSLRRASKDAFERGLLLLQVSRWATALALALFLSVVALLFFAPHDPAKPVSIHGSATTSPARTADP